MRASRLVHFLDYPNFPEFRARGIDLSLTHADVILYLQRMRNIAGFPIYPGPYQENWGRKYGSTDSEHYAVNRLSRAGDVFARRGKALDLWLIALSFNRIKGIGLYADTKGVDGTPWPMLHFDLREGARLEWVRENGFYYYPTSHPREFWRIMKKIIDFERQQ